MTRAPVTLAAVSPAVRRQGHRFVLDRRGAYCERCGLAVYVEFAATLRFGQRLATRVYAFDARGRKVPPGRVVCRADAPLPLPPEAPRAR